MPATPKLFVTGATGQLGRLVVDALLRAMPAGRIVAGARDPDGEAAAALRDAGVEVRRIDYARPGTLAAAFAGIDRLLLVSGNEMGARVAQHRAVIDAAKAAGVGFVAYTSILHADTTPLALAADHRATEAALRGSGIPYALLRNGWYSEVYTWRLPAALASGTLIGAAGAGRVSAAARADYAAAAARVLAGGDHDGRTYELAGDAAFTLAELTAVAAEAAGRPIAYRDMTPPAFEAAAVAAGTPPALAAIFADTDAGVAQDALFDDGCELARLIGRPTTPYADAIRSFVAETQAGQRRG